MATPETTDDARAESRGKLANRAVRVPAILLLLCALYVLSIGPAVAICTWANLAPAWTGPVPRAWVGPATHPGVGRALDTFYAPVVYLYRSTPLKEPIERYIDWWEALGERLR
jgi:hypothetical protein